MSPGLLSYLAIIAIGSFLGGLAPLAGGWSRHSLLVPVAFSGGILLGAAFFDMIPEAAPMLGPWLGWPLVAGFLSIFVLERFVLVHPYPEHAGAHGHEHHLHLGLTAYAGAFLSQPARRAGDQLDLQSSRVGRCGTAGGDLP